MALSDMQNFLVDLFSRFDSSLDLTDGSRAQSQLIEPILARIGGDPFDEDIEVFIRTRLQQVFPQLAISTADELTDVLIDPLRVLFEPLTREIQLVKLRTSLANVAALSDDEVDALMSNFFEPRRAGGFAAGVVRAYFAAPQQASATLVNVAQSRDGYRYTVTRAQSITADQMLLNIDGSEFYFDINYIAEARGDEYNVDRGEINSITNLPSAVRVTNPRRFQSGIARESSEEYVGRVQQGASEKTLTTAPGIAAVLPDAFPTLRQLFAVGMGDPEMKRDILRGGSLGSIPARDDLGEFFGLATAVDDLDADNTTQVIEAAEGNFITRIGPAGRTPDGWWITVVFTAGTLTVYDAQVLEVISDTRVRLDREIPLSLVAGGITWMLREKKLTITDIPGGIALPDSINGTLSLPSDSVHIGGKTDIFVAGAVDGASAQITGLSDERPVARGFAAITHGGSTGGSDPNYAVGEVQFQTTMMGVVTFEVGMTYLLGPDLNAYTVTEFTITDPGLADHYGESVRAMVVSVNPGVEYELPSDTATNAVIEGYPVYTLYEDGGHEGSMNVLGITLPAAISEADIVQLTDLASSLFGDLQAGMSLVLSEGADVGAYRIVEVLANPSRVRLDTAMTGAQSNLAWKVVDEIDVDLINPKDILLEGSDLILSAGSPVVLAGSGINFAGAGIRNGDVLFVDDAQYGGDFTITEASASSLTIDPPAPRALSGVHYVISRRSEGVQPPVVRIAGLELLDSAGAPNGTVIPYREPVLCLSRAFQNEASGFLYEGPALIGLVSRGFSGGVNLGGLSIQWAVYRPDRVWGLDGATGVITFSEVTTIAQAAAAINLDGPLTAQGVRAVVLTSGGQTFLGISCQKLVSFTGGNALTSLGLQPGATNAQVRLSNGLARLKVRRGDLIECVGGSNAGAGVRVIADPTYQIDRAVTGTGPLGPPGTMALYGLAVLNPDVSSRVRIARPSVGTIRCYFLSPTSVDFPYATTRFEVTLNGQLRVFMPDPENMRTLMPPPPTKTLPSTGTTNPAGGTLTDTEAAFLRYGIQPGDLLDILYRPIVATTSVDTSSPLAVGGQTLLVRLDDDPMIQVSFPYAMTPQNVVDYINTQVGETIAKLVADTFVLASSRRIELGASSSALATMALTVLNNDHPSKGTYVIKTVTQTILTVSAATPLQGGSTASTRYRVRRYLQRISSTEMNLNLDASGLYYVDVEAVSVLPGDLNNIDANVELEPSGYRSDGYRLISTRPELSFSRAEELRAEISRTILLVGASDDPRDYVQLNLQNVQVNYERSSLADDCQSFCSSQFQRVICEDILVRHLLPHYLSLNWRYSGGPAEPEMTRALVDRIAAVGGGEQLEVGNLRDILTGKQATSVFTPDTSTKTGRSAPLLLVVRHEESRRVRASLVTDVIDTVRMATYLPDSLVLKRLSSAGLR